MFYKKKIRIWLVFRLKNEMGRDDFPPPKHVDPQVVLELRMGVQGGGMGWKGHEVNTAFPFAINNAKAINRPRKRGSRGNSLVGCRV